MPTTDLRLSARRPGWVDDAVAGVSRDGYAIVEDVLPTDLRERTRTAMYTVQRHIVADLGPERLERAGELGVLRLMVGYDESFRHLLGLDEVLAVVDRTVSPTAILHLQNGLILPPAAGGEAPDRFQTSFHRDFPRHLDGYLASINTLLAVDEFTEANGATLLVPGSHQRPDAPTRDELEAAVPAVCPAGSMIVFDSTLWHAAGANRSGRERLAVNQQFTRSFIKPQIDYVRALGDEAVLRQRPRTQQLLGWYTRVVTSLDEYYRPPGERLYRGGQG
jgi:ectoine hydroxylase-related dioxygenase (phytanoyl-CoA dioxygenase family)